MSNWDNPGRRPESRHELSNIDEHPAVLHINTAPSESLANTRHLHNIYTTSAQRLRRWSNIA